MTLISAQFVGWEPLAGLERRLYRRIIAPLLPPLPPSDRIAIIAVDDRSLEAFGGRWPLPAATWAEVLVRLGLHEPEAVILDVAFDRSDSEEVLALAREVRSAFEATRYGQSDGAHALLEVLEDRARRREGDTLVAAAMKDLNVVLSVVFSEVASSPVIPEQPRALTWIEADVPPTVSLTRPGVNPTPPSIFSAARAHGGMNLLTEGGARIQRYAYAIAHRGAIYPSLALAAALATSRPEAHEALVTQAVGADEAAPLLRFREPQGDTPRFLTVSLSDVLSEGEEAHRTLTALRGRTVFIGPTAEAIGDLFVTPSGTPIAGVEVHATALENLWTSHWVESHGAARWLTLAVSLCILIAFALTIERVSRIGLLILIALGALALEVGLAVLLVVTSGLLIGLAPSALGLGAMGLLGLWSRLRWARREQTRLGARERVLETERAALERFRAVVEHVGDAIVSVDENQVVRWMNPAAESLFSRRARTAIDRPVGELVTHFDGPRDLGQVLEAQARVGGESIPLEATASTMTVGDERFTNYVFRDVAARKAVERQKDEFIASINHELRTPITSIIGSLRLLGAGAMGELPPRVRDLLAIAEKNGERLLALVSDLLDAARIDAGRLALERRPVALAALLDEARARHEGFGQRFNVHLALTALEPSLAAATLDVDRERIIQVLGNLVSNAIKHSPEGATVTIEAQRRGSHRVRISVIDTGPGLGSEAQDLVFERFTMTVAGDGRRRPGAGLGLSIAKSLIESHGGTIGLDSAPGEGATFWFELPLLA
jgi:PAS domain S-box-containing protein